MKRKKIASICLGAILVLGLSACDGFSFGSTGRSNVPPTFTESDDENEDEDEEEEEIDKRISVATSVASLTDEAQNATATYQNQSVLSLKAKGDVDGNITYTVSGTASVMSKAQADVYWLNVAQEFDAYIVLNISLEEGETVVWSAPGKVKTIKYEETEHDDGSEDLILRISGESCYGSKVTFIITDSDGHSTDHIVDLSSVAIVDSRIVLTTTETVQFASEDPFQNPTDGSLYIESISEDASGNLTYYVKGTPNHMNDGQATAFGGDAATGDAYVVVAITLKVDETLTWGGDKTASYCETDYVGYIVNRVANYGSSTYTISKSGSSVTHTVDFSGLTH